MNDTILELEQIEDAIVTWIPEFQVRSHIVVPNVSWGLLNHEADLLVMSKAGYLTEIEIKRSWHDFMKDFQKSHTHNDEKISSLYYAVPKLIAPKVADYLFKLKTTYSAYDKEHKNPHIGVDGYTEHNPNHCGLITYEHTERKGKPIAYASIMFVAEKRGKYKLSQNEQYQLMRLGLMRVWNLKKKVSQLENDLYEATKLPSIPVLRLREHL